MNRAILEVQGAQKHEGCQEEEGDEGGGTQKLKAQPSSSLGWLSLLAKKQPAN